MSESQAPTSEIGRRIANLTPEQRLILERRLSRAQTRQERPAAAIPRREESGPAPLSFSQERLWFLEQLHPGTGLYAMPVAVRLTGPLSPDALKRSLAEIVRRHEALRTTFHAWRGEPRQEVAPPGPPEVTWIDLRLIDPELREAEARARMEEEAYRPFRLETGPLLRTTVLRLAAEEHLLLLVLHHIVADGWSLGVLVRELAFFYGGFAAGGAPRLPELPIQVADFAAWQRRWLAGAELEERIGYWRRQLAGAPTTLELPADRARPAAPTFAGASRPFRLDGGLAGSLAALARERGATLYMVLLAAFDVLLWRYTGQEDLLVASPVANRNRTEVEALIGFFTNTLVLRARLDGGLSFAELLDRVRTTSLDAQAHQDLPFERLVEELQPERSLVHSPLVQVMLALQNAPLPPMAMGGLELQPVELPSRTAKFDLLLELHPDGDALAGNVEHSAELFDGSTLERWIGTFARLLEGAAAAPDTRLEDLPVLDAAQTQQLLLEWNGAPGAEPRAVLERFAEQVERTPDAAALLDWNGDRLCYRELDRRSARLARFLRGRGVGLETPVGILMERSLETVVAVLAVLRAGGAYLPLDPSYPDDRLAFMVRDARAAALLTQELLAHRVPDVPETILLDRGFELPEETSGEALAVPPPDALAYLIYTSGSTGRPKGVAMRHGPLSNLLEWQLADLPGAARTLQFTPLSFDVSFQEIFSTLISGGTLVLVPDELRRDPDALWRYLGDQRVERLFLPFVALQQLAAAAARDLTSAGMALKEIVTAGEQLQVTPLVAALLERLGGRLDNQYGPTETHVVTFHTLTGDPSEWPALPPIGRPIARGEALVLDRSLRPVPAGGVGEVYLGGATLARGYHGRGDLTAERFLPHPFARTAGDRIYRTGDLARQLSDGSLQFLGRRDHEVKIRGFRVDLGEVEAVLLSHPRVARAAVALREGAAGDRRLVAWIVPGGPTEGTAGIAGNAGTVDDVRSFLRGRLPDYMVPRAMVVLDSLPLTPSGKVDRRSLAVPDLEEEGAETRSAGFASPAEELLAGIWSEVLGRPVAGSGSHFFELGGHSLLATQVTSRIRDVFQAALPVRDLFAHPTLSALARRIEAARTGSSAGSVGSVGDIPPVRPVPRDRDLPLSFGQERLWFLEQLHPGSPLYHLPAALEVRGRLRPEVLAGSLTALVGRHESLRTTFHSTGGRPVQVVEPPFDVALPVVDLGGLDATRQAEESRRRAAEEVRRPFDLERGPLFRAGLVRLSPESHLLLLCFHHMVADGWSMGPLVRDLALGCAALAEGRSPCPPELPVQVPDFAAWQREQLAGEVLEEELRYWRRQLAGAPPVLEIPTDRPRPAVPGFRGANHRFALPAELAGRLGAVARRQGATLFMTLASGLATLLGRLAGEEDLTLGSPIANRQRPELEGLIGLLMNMLALRVDLGGDPPFSGLLSRVRAVTLGAYDHQDLPFEKLVEEVVEQRSLEVSPVFQVLLALQNAPRAALDLPGLQVVPRAVETGTAKFDLSFYLEDDGAGGLDGILEHSLELFDRTTAARLARQLRTLLTAAAAEPDRALASLPLLDGAERHQLLVEGNDTAMPLPPAASIHALFDAQTARTPDAEALVCGDLVLTYRELARRAAGLARHLRARGVGPDRRVGLLLGRSEDLVTAMLAVLAAGGAYLPLDPAYPADRLAFMAGDAGLTLLLTEAPFAGLLAGVVPEELTLRLDAGRELLFQDSGPLRDDVRPENLAYVIYTSGSTGRPKGVLVTHGTALNFFAGMDEVLGAGPRPGDTWLAVTSVSFDISVLELLWTLCRGFRVAVQAPPRAAARTGTPAALDFSLFYFASESAGAGSGRDRYRLLLEGARFADRHGFSAVWTPERHFHSFGGLYPNPAVAGAALAVATERIGIRAGSVVLPLQNPLRVAEEWSVVDNLSNGRVGVSFASGWHADDFVLAPDRYQDRRDILFRDLELVRRLWRGAKVALPNGAGRPAEVGIHPPPVQDELPFWITAGGSPETFRLAGEAGGYLLTHLLGQTVGELAEKVAVYREARRRAGHAGPGRVSLMVHTFVGDDPARVRDTVWGPFRAYLASSVDLLANLGRSLGLDVRSQGFTPEDMEALLDHACERYFHEGALFGTPESCLENVDRFLAADVDELACLIDFGIPADEVLASLERLDELRQRGQARAEAAALQATGSEPVPVPVLVRRHAVTHLQCTPSMARMLAATPDGREALGALRTLLVGGEALPEPLAQELLEAVPGRVLNMYGPTETTVWSTCQPVDGGPVTVGRPIANTEVHVLGPDLERMPIGIPGEVYLGGLGVTRGYHRRPDLTAERFVPDPFDRRTGGRLYRTGDRARTRPDGTLEFLGRLDHQVKIRGYRIEPGEIETALAGHPSVREAVVVARQDDGAEPQLVAYVVPAGAPALEPRLSPEERLAGLPSYRWPNGMVVSHLSDFQAAQLYEEVFRDRLYLRYGVTLHDGDCVFDVGANIGTFTLFAHTRARDLKVFAFEPIPPTFQALKANAELYGLEARIFNCGVSRRPEVADFTFYPEMAGLSSRYSDAEKDRRMTRAIIQDGLKDNGLGATEIEEWLDDRFRSETHRCELRPLSAVIAEHGVERIDLLKVDVERAELDVLAGLSDEDWPRIRQVVLEVDGRANLREVKAILAARGFQVAVDDLVVVKGEGDDDVAVYMVYARREGLDLAAVQPEPVPSAGELASVLRGHLMKGLPNYMMPAAFVTLDRFPFTPNGKVDRRALPAPGGRSSRVQGAYQAPETQIEKGLADIWKEVLRVESVGLADNFFELGGNSLMVVQMRSAIRERLGIDISLVELFRSPNIALLARSLEAGQGPAPKATFDEVRSRTDQQKAARDRRREVAQKTRGLR